MNSELPLVTIGVPIYNGARHVTNALESLLAQDYRHIEILISDNGSTDGSIEICQAFAARDTRIRVHSQPMNIGAIPNFRWLADAAASPYFMWAAVDDTWLPGFVGRMVGELERHPNAGVAMSAIDRVYESGALYDHVRFGGRDDVNDKGHFELARQLTSPKKYNLFIYGLFRTPLLKAAMAFVPQVPTWERLLLCQIALVARFRYVDEMLHVRMHHDAPSHERLPDEVFNRIQTQERWFEVDILRGYAAMLASSSVIPWFRKAYAPVILQRHGWMLLRPRLASRLQRGMGGAAWRSLEPLRRFLRRRPAL